MDWLCLLYEHDGEVNWPVSAFGQYCGISEEVAHHVLEELELTNVANVEWQNPNKSITKLSNRRMVRAVQHREHIKVVRSAAGKKGMAKRYQNYQPSSSTSSSLSLNSDSSKKNYLPRDVSAKPSRSGTSADWPDDSLWLKDFLETQRYVTTPNGTLMNPVWWNSVSETCGGLVREWLETEFARISAWLVENPSRSPASPKGWKRFIRHWLEKAHDMERRKAYADTRGSPGYQQRRR